MPALPPSSTPSPTPPQWRGKLHHAGSRLTHWFATLASGKLLVFWRIAMQNYRRSQLTRMAAALSFRTIFGLIPTLVVGLVVLHAFVSDEQVKALVTETLKFTGLDQIAVDEAKVREAQAAQQLQANSINVFGFGLAEQAGPLSQIPSTLAAPAPAVPASNVQTARLDEWITNLMSRIDGINFGALGLVGALMLIYAAISMVVETEKCFNQICGATLGKSWLRRVKDYWALLTLGPLLLVASFGVRAGVERIAVNALGEGTHVREVRQEATQELAQQEFAHQELAHQELARKEAKPFAPALSAGASSPVKAVLASDKKPGWLSRASISLTKFVLSVAISTGMLMVVFAAVPNLRVRVAPAFTGAVISAVLWEVSKSLLGAYIANSMKSGYAALYGAVAIVPLFMLWVYVTWLILLLGFQVTSTLQQYQSVSREGFRHGMLVALGLERDETQVEGLRLIDPAAAVLVLGCASQRFSAGLATASTDVRAATGLEPAVATMLLGVLARGGWLHRVVSQNEAQTDAAADATAQHADDVRYTLAKDPSEILATEVLQYAEAQGRSVQQDAALLALPTDDGVPGRPIATVQSSASPATVLDIISAAKHRALAGKSIASIRTSPREM